LSIRQIDLHRLQGLQGGMSLHAIFINPEDHSAEKCNFCAHRIDWDLTRLRRRSAQRKRFWFGDMNDHRIVRFTNHYREPSQCGVPKKRRCQSFFTKVRTRRRLESARRAAADGGLFMGASNRKTPASSFDPITAEAVAVDDVTRMRSCVCGLETTCEEFSCCRSTMKSRVGRRAASGSERAWCDLVKKLCSVSFSGRPHCDRPRD